MGRLGGLQTHSRLCLPLAAPPTLPCLSLPPPPQGGARQVNTNPAAWAPPRQSHLGPGPAGKLALPEAQACESAADTRGRLALGIGGRWGVGGTCLGTAAGLWGFFPWFWTPGLKPEGREEELPPLWSGWGWQGGLQPPPPWVRRRVPH